MSPVPTDNFSTQDFADTFGILDQNPGVLCVPNQAARPSTWTHLQHGRTVRQMDQRIDWVWEKPTSGSTGVWKRYWGKGILHQQSNAGAVTSAATVYASGATVIQTPSILIPGGRPVRVWIRWANCGNTNGLAVGSYWEGSSVIYSWAINGYDYTSNQWAHLGLSSMFMISRDLAPTTQVNVTFKWTLSAYAFGLGGTSTMRDTVLIVEEM